MSDLHATLFSKKTGVCMQCSMTEKQFILEGIPYTKKFVEDHREELIKMGHQSAPIIVVSDGTSWTGFRPDEIKNLKEKIEQVA